jgi:hypothetical protein
MSQPIAPVYAGGIPPKRRRTGRAVAAVIVAFVAVVIAISAVAHASHPAARGHGGTLTSSGNTAHPPQDDVAIQPDGCVVDEFGMAKAELTVVNHSSRASDYAITVEFVNSRGTRLAEGAGIQTSVAAGQTVQLEVMGDQQLRGPVSCHVTKVDRYAS